MMLNARVEFPEKTFDNVKLKAAPRRWDLFRMEDDAAEEDEETVHYGEVYEVEWTPDLSTDLVVRVRAREAKP